jgi:hypothetical protein
MDGTVWRVGATHPSPYYDVGAWNSSEPGDDKCSDSAIRLFVGDLGDEYIREDFLAATAAYAAVLVVFIGTSAPQAPLPSS